MRTKECIGRLHVRYASFMAHFVLILNSATSIFFLEVCLIGDSLLYVSNERDASKLLMHELGTVLSTRCRLWVDMGVHYWYGESARCLWRPLSQPLGKKCFACYTDNSPGIQFVWTLGCFLLRHVVLVPIALRKIGKPSHRHNKSNP
jgi:hypothetical protein